MTLSPQAAMWNSIKHLPDADIKTLFVNASPATRQVYAGWLRAFTNEVMKGQVTPVNAVTAMDLGEDDDGFFEACIATKYVGRILSMDEVIEASQAMVEAISGEKWFDGLSTGIMLARAFPI